MEENKKYNYIVRYLLEYSAILVCWKYPVKSVAFYIRSRSYDDAGLLNIRRRYLLTLFSTLCKYLMENVLAVDLAGTM
jgi:hypothetical protein